MCWGFRKPVWGWFLGFVRAYASDLRFSDEVWRAKSGFHYVSLSLLHPLTIGTELVLGTTSLQLKARVWQRGFNPLICQTLTLYFCLNQLQASQLMKGPTLILKGAAAYCLAYRRATEESFNDMYFTISNLEGHPYNRDVQVFGDPTYHYQITLSNAWGKIQSMKWRQTPNQRSGEIFWHSRLCPQGSGQECAIQWSLGCC